MANFRCLCLGILLTLPASGLAAADTAPIQATNAGHSSGRLPDGAAYSVDQPARWNGTVLLWAHGYARAPVGPDVPTAPPSLRDTLLAQGYALVASGYAQPGWALATAPDDQLGALAAYAARYGHPKRVIAWGASMGGLVTVALAERKQDGIDGALPVCGSVTGPLPMMNMALDGAFAFATLAAPQAGVRLVHTQDDRANGSAAQRAVTAVQATPEGRARLALAATLGGVPGWTERGTPRPAADDAAAEEAQQAAGFVFGIFLPRAGQEALAGGNFSGNTGIDYADLLRRSGREAYVAGLYDVAHLRLADDLAQLAAAPRIAAEPRAVAYMRAHYTATGDIGVPMLSMHTLGDGMTSPSLETAYAALVQKAGRAALLKDVFVEQAGHCNFSNAAYLYALDRLLRRVATGRWDEAAAPADAQVSGETPTPMPRP